MSLSATPASDALSAFLRGVERRARLFAEVQSGSVEAATRAMSVVARVFAGDAGRCPMAHWPVQYWRLLLATPQLRTTEGARTTALLPAIARLSLATRTSVLLPSTKVTRNVAGMAILSRLATVTSAPLAGSLSM